MKPYFEVDFNVDNFYHMTYTKKLANTVSKVKTNFDF